jgi:hypothetical protein
LANPERYGSFSPDPQIFTTSLQHATYISFRAPALVQPQPDSRQGFRVGWAQTRAESTLREVNMDLLYIGLAVVFLVLSVALVYGFEKLRRPK